MSEANAKALGSHTVGAPPAAQQTRREFITDQEVRWGPGCGDYSILAQVQKIMPELGIAREDIVFVAGIGCSSRFPYYMNTYGFHTIHGRAPGIATGVKLANPELTVFVVTGDGDGLSIGGNHLLHALRRNVDLKILLFNNRIYGLTKGQYSPTSEVGKITKSSPFGTVERPLEPIAVALAAEATFVARSVDVQAQHLQAVVKRAAAHRGSAFVEILQNCNVFNDGAWTSVTERDVRDDRQLTLEHGKPMVFGKDRTKGIRLRGFEPEVVTLGKDGVTEKDLLVHDEKERHGSLAYILSRMNPPEFPLTLGVFRQIEFPTYETKVHEQVRKAREKAGPGDLAKLIAGPETWEVRPDGSKVAHGEM